MKRFVRPLLDRLPYIKDLRAQVLKQGAVTAGHYYSPIPNHAEALTYVKSRERENVEIPGIDLNKAEQFQLLQEYAQFYDELPFPEESNTTYRYYFENGWYSYSDAIFLYSFLRRHRPKRIIEIGSGFSSAVMLDTIDQFFDQRPHLTFIDPEPERLNHLLREDDRAHTTILPKRIQEVPLDTFSSLQAGDLLFVDSSHVVKCGSDLHWILFDIFPRLPKGVFVHFHDIFYPFEYPVDWLERGVYWNEVYFLRAFLSYNPEWRIHFFDTYATSVFGDFIKTNMGACLKDSGSSLYLQKL